ncbi:hypothetical protein N7466_006562 [Penicillium verhagenii]|uniref:uncharacterized protein n=1 Tax=Penicillium verhagenii TaxID=1562060 RepID=UPI0025457D62|nr:uncharacterized protein N7466_006562 [Penicillium verhagenii]KAJ5931069.1 hypothetical protein N7466_006562 [Penicillium verhagenii]
MLNRSPNPIMEPNKRAKLVIGMDFGTTFSGIAWALEGLETQPTVIQEWPGKGNSTSQKTPTVISYQDGEVRWGYQVNEYKPAVRGVKLLLDKGRQMTTYGPALESEVIIQDLKKEPVDIAGDYMMMMVSHVKRVLDRRGIGSLMNTLNVKYVLTIPGVCSDKAKDLTMQAACLAGIPQSDLSLLSEPEAAAVYAIKTIQPNAMAKDDCFIVCDAGGGTVDLITYKITQMNPLRMEEVVEGTGEICGSVMLDELFEQYVKRTIGETEYNGLNESSKRIAMQKWQNDIKPLYSGPVDDDGFTYTGDAIPIPGIKDGILHMESEDVQKIFDPVVAKIEALIRAQNVSVQNAGLSAKAIVLVGGLGASAYLYNRLKSYFKEMEIMQPLNAWSAVVRGAVYRGIQGNQVENRKARSHYGIEISAIFDPTKHRREDRYWCDFYEKWLARYQMQWYIHKGDAISEDRPITFPFWRRVPTNSSLTFQDDLKFCLIQDAPPIVTSDVAVLCTLTSDLSRIPKELFEKLTNSRGVEYYVIKFELVLTPFSASMLFELQFNGERYGSVQAEYV